MAMQGKNNYSYAIYLQPIIARTAMLHMVLRSHSHSKHDLSLIHI